MLKGSTVLVSGILAIAPLGMALQGNADTARASCVVYPKGEDRASWSGICTFSQRQGVVNIQLQNGKRYDLVPIGQTNKFRDQNGRPGHRESDGPREIFRLSTESIYVMFDDGASGQISSGSPVSGSASTRPPATGTRISGRGVSTLTSRDPNVRINVRSQPTINSSSPHYGVPGDKVTVIRCVQDQDTAGSDLNWCNVQFVSSKATGWIRSDFIIFADGGE